jgi:CyaY protein
MDEKSYRALAYETLSKVVDLFDEVDVEDADVETSGDVVTIRYRDGSRCVVNTQSPVQQIWLAGAGRGWHFAWDESRAAWMDDRGEGDELFAMLRKITKDTVGISLGS